MTADRSFVGAYPEQEVCIQPCLHCRCMINTGMHAYACMTRHCPAQELSWLAGYDSGSEDKKRSILSVTAEAVLLALHRPLAV